MVAPGLSFPYRQDLDQDQQKVKDGSWKKYRRMIITKLPSYRKQKGKLWKLLKQRIARSKKNSIRRAMSFEQKRGARFAPMEIGSMTRKKVSTAGADLAEDRLVKKGSRVAGKSSGPLHKGAESLELNPGCP